MSGHSKWSTIKRKKAKVDAVRGRIFTQLGKEIIMAAKAGGGDPDNNLRLKNAIAKAKEANIPNENIQRAIMKGTGELGGGNYEEIVYEGYGPGGVAVMLEAMTDNRNRTAGEVRHLFSKYGGNLGESGCVSWMFEKKGVIVVEKGPEVDEDDLLMAALDAGAEDVKSEDDDAFEIITDPDSFEAVRDALSEKGVKYTEAQVSMIPKTTVKIEGAQAEMMLKLMDSLEELDDVNDLYTNFEMD
ncbi:MAG: YebC/PmpR family DNA-binding transcriptional regulator [Bacillota bacterium]